MSGRSSSQSTSQSTSQSSSAVSAQSSSAVSSRSSIAVDATAPLLADEGRHADVAVEAWWFWGADAAGGAGVFVGIEMRGRRFDYWAGLVRDGEPYLYVEELDGSGWRGGLEIKPPEMWADHVCDVPMRQWSLGNEAHGVLLEDPTEAWRR
ncbi:MAG: hypothetical protein ABIR68_10585, partial [Ilumatobacteraceae bacterium]